MKRIILLTLAAAVSANAFGQRLPKYKDIYAALGNEPVEHSMLKLQEYQTLYHDFPNTYLQMGVISYNWLKEEDPFLNYSYVQRLAYNSKLYLGLAKKKIQADEKEVKKNRQYYANLNIGDIDNIDQQDVLDYIDKILAKINEYDKNVSLIIDNYNRTVEKYNECISSYKGIVARQNNYKNLLLTTSGDLRKQMTELSENFDSVTYYFDEFKTALGSYPIKDYNQQTKVVSINTYRLEGLTSSNFLKPEIPIWDYHKWVSEAFATMDGNISTLKTQSKSEIKSIRDKVSSLKAKKAETDSVQEIVPSDKLVSLIEKYDYESLLTSSINYEAAKANFQIASMRSANNVNSQAAYSEDLGKKANYYYDLYLMDEQAKSELQTQVKRITDNNITKHEQLVNDIYGGADKMKNSYARQESSELQKLQSENNSNFQKFVVEQVYPENMDINHSGKTISIRPSDTKFEAATVGTYRTLYTIKDGFGHRYVSGYIKTSATASNGFVAMLNSDGTAAWVTTVNAQNGGANQVVQVIPSQFAGALAIVASPANNICKTSAVRLDANGKQTMSGEFSSPRFPTYGCYDEISETVTAVFKGDNGNYDVSSAESCDMESVVLGSKTSTSTPSVFSLKGQVVDIVPVKDGYMVVCNYRELKLGTSLNTSASNIAAVLVTPTEAKASIFPTTKEMRAVKAFKVNAETISILGTENPMDKMVTTLEKPAYILLKTDGEFVK